MYSDGGRTPLPGQVRVNGRQGCVRPEIRVPILILGDEAEEAVRFVGDSSSEIDPAAQWKKIP